MIQQNLTYDEIVSLINAFEASSEFNRFHLRYLDLELDLEKKGAIPIDGGGSWRGSASAAPHHTASSASALQVHVPTPLKASEAVEAAHATLASSPAQTVDSHEGLLKITSPMVGTFYVSPEPGAAAFVSVGQKVNAQTQVCIIEVMKLMSSIEAGVSGTIQEVMVKNNEPVEFGQVLFWVRPD